MLKELKDEVSSASVENVYDEIVEIYLDNEEKKKKHSIKMKEILGELESSDYDNDLVSTPDIFETNSNDESKVDHIVLPIKK